jgi:multidrug resistance efflux pump
MSERLTPIPTPATLRWRNFRLQYVPILVFLLGLAAATFLWTEWVAPPTLVGEAEAIRTELRSAQAGRLQELKAELLQRVRAGDVLGTVIVSEPRVMESSLAVIRAEIEVLRTTTSLTIEQLRLDWMNKRVQLVALQGQLHQAEATLARSTALHRTRLITDEEFDQARTARDSLVAQIKAQTELIQRLEPEVRPGESDNRAIPTATQGLQAAINQREQQLRLIEAQLAPLPLIAPIDGVVTMVWRRSGETVGTAEPILQISATGYQRIVGFMRPPITVEVKPGMSVEVRTRTFQRRVGEAVIAQVGEQFEPITPTLLAAMRLPVVTIPTEYGLRVHVSAPTGLDLRPGEHVDLILRN